MPTTTQRQLFILRLRQGFGFRNYYPAIDSESPDDSLLSLLLLLSLLFLILLIPSSSTHTHTMSRTPSTLSMAQMVCSDVPYGRVPLLSAHKPHSLPFRESGNQGIRYDPESMYNPLKTLAVSCSARSPFSPLYRRHS